MLCYAMPCYAADGPAVAHRQGETNDNIDNHANNHITTTTNNDNDNYNNNSNNHNTHSNDNMQ